MASIWGTEEAMQCKSIVLSFYEVISDAQMMGGEGSHQRLMTPRTLPAIQEALAFGITLLSLRCEDLGNWKVWETNINSVG